MGNSKVKKIIIIAIIIILAILAIVGKILYDNSRKYEIETVTSIDYLLLVENARCGVINRNGDVLITPMYDEIQIPNPSKPVFICMSNYNEETQKYDVAVLNEKAERILYEYVIVRAVDIENSTSDIPYEKSVLKYQQDGKWGLINFNGKKITKPIYEEINGITYREGLLKVKKDSKYGVINIKGTTIIKNKYDNIKCDGYYNEAGNYNNAGFIVSNTTSNGYRYGYINYNGKVILKPEYNDITRILDKKDDKNAYLIAFKNGMAAVLKNNKAILNHEYEDIFYNHENDLLIVQKSSKQGVIKLDGSTVIPIEYTNIIISGKFINAQKDNTVDIFDINGNSKNLKGYINITPAENENYNIVITAEDEYKIIDNNANVITKQSYQNIKSINETNFIAQKDDKYGIINIAEETKVDFNYDVMQVLNGTQIIQALKFDGNITELYDFNLNKIAEVEKANIFLKGTFLKIVSNNNIQYFDYSGKQLKNTEVYNNNNLYAVKQNDKWGFIDKQGNVVVTPEYDMVTEFNEYGFAAIKKDDKWGSISAEGKVVIEPTYKIIDILPEFIGQYYKVDYGYGMPYYTKDVLDNNYI